MTQTLDKLLTIQDVSEFLNLSVRKIHRLMASGDLGYIKIGKSTRFRPSAIESYLKRNEVSCSTAS